MKKSVGKVSIITTALSMLLGVPLIVLTNKGVTKVDGYSASSLPTTIDLNDTSAANIRSYYSTLNSLDTSQRQGTNLLKNLKTILKNNQKYFSYENGENVWKMYEITDRDWAKSPATSISGYNSSTKVITGYTYNTSDPYIHALYINRNITNQTKAWADHQQTQWGINREHVWPKAEGFDTSGAGGARGDPMHLMAGNGYANNIHSNNYYGYVNTSTTYTNCGTKYSNLSGNLSGKSKTLGGSTTVFEPQDSDKGDIARSIFYMVARYNYLSGSDSDGINSNNPNLTLTQSLSDWKSSGYTSTTSNPGKMGIMTDLLAWHKADPVDEFEIHRNNLLYTNFTNNRNPFIDFPEWADYIWGTVSYSGSTYNSYSSSPTGYATPSTDTINGYNSGGSQETVDVTGVSLNTNSTEVEVGRDVALTVSIMPNNATNQNVTWSTSDASIATVSGGIVTGVSKGSATITATTSDGGFTATCSVTVTASSGSGETGTTYDLYTSALTDGSYILTHESDEAIKNTITSNRADVQSVTVENNKITDATASIVWQAKSHTENNSTYWTFYNAEVGKYLSATSSNNQCSLVDNYSDSKARWTVTLSDSAFSIVNNSNSRYLRCNTTIDVHGFGCYASSTGKNLTFYKETQGSAGVKELESISLDTSDAQTTFEVGETFNYDDLVVTAHYNDGSFDIVYSGYTVSSPNMSTEGEKTVTVTYEGKEAEYNINVIDSSRMLTSISISGQTTSFTVGDTFEFGGTVTATYSDESSSDVTSLATFSGYDMSSAGVQTVTVSFGGETTTYEITVSNPPAESGSADNPFSVVQARAAIDAAGSSSIANQYTRGIIFQIDGYDSTYKSITYWISDDGTETNPLMVYSGKGLNQANFSSINDLTVGDYVVIKGSLKKYGSIYEYYYDNYLISRVPAGSTQYDLVTNVSSLKTNDEIMFVGYRQGYGTYHSITSYDSGTKVLTAASTSVTDSSTLNNGTYMRFTIVRNGDNFSFANENGKYLSSSTATKVHFEDSITENYSKFALTIGSDGKITMSINTTYFRFNYNSGNSRFTCYGSSTYGDHVYIYKKSSQIEADTWATTFLSQTKNCNVSSWSSLASSYSTLPNNAKLEIVNCEANASTDYCYRSQAMARYEYILGDSRFNSGLSTFVTGRSVSPARPNLIPMILSGENSNVAIIIIISLVSLSTVGGYFFLKSRRKENI